MRTRFLVFASLLLCTAAIASPRAKTDSLLKAYRSQKDTAQVLTLVKLSQSYFGSDNDSGMYYSRLLVAGAEKWGNPARMSDAYVILGTAFHNLGDFDSAMYCKKKALAIAEKNNYRKGIGNACNDIGLYEKENGRLDTALKYILRAVDTRIAIQDNKALGNSYVNLALIFYAQQDYPNALNYYDKAGKLFLQLGLAKNYALVLNNTAAIYDDQKDYDKALVYYNRSLAICDSIGDKRESSRAEVNIGVLYREKGNYDEAEKHFLKSLSLKEEVKDVQGQAVCLLDLAQNYRYQKKYAKAKESLERSEKLADETQLKETQRDICLEYSELYKAQGNDALALEYLQRYIAKKDSIFNDEKIQALADMRTKYETVQKEKENGQLKQEAQARELELNKRDLEIERGKSKMILLYAGLGILIVILGFAVFAILVTRKNSRLLGEKNEQISRHNNTLKDLNKKLIASEEELTGLNKTKDKLFSVISHDISNPVKAIANYNQAILSKEKLLSREELADALKKMNQSVQPLQGFIDNLLHWSLLQRNGATTSPENFDAHEATMEIIALYLPYAHQKKIALHSSIPPGIQVFADKNMFRLTLRNLISNAIKFTGENGKVEITATEKSGSVEFCVSDNGAGLSPEKIQSVLAGKQLVSEKGTYAETGTGLGLNLVTEYLRTNGSDLRIESKTGEGARFYFSLQVK